MRIPDWTPKLKPQPQELVDAILARRGGALLNLDKALLWSEALARGWNVFLKAVRTELPTSRRLRELGICSVALLTGANYEYHHHAPDFLSAGGTQAQLDALQAFIKDELTRHNKLVLMGDFNITWDDLDVWDPVALAGTIHCTDEERAHFKALLDLGLTDAFRLFEQAPKSYSWWDYREFAFKRNRGLRIDHILVSSALVKSVTACVIDKAPRKNERPSDHTPVTVTL